MIKKAKKMTKKDFSVKGGSFSVFSPIFSIKALENKDKNKYAVIVSKKICKKATDRNLLKRRFFEAIKEKEGIFPVGFSYIFYVKKEAVNKKPLEIKDFLEKSIKKPKN